ncbi:MAG: class I SAM-dependent methyltransferase [Chloroflexota bacterium]
MSEGRVKRQVREFYDQIGWQEVGSGLYQNARYEDLRPVSREYIHRCHLRVGRHLAPEGRFLLDAGSGPVQYPEYLTYSQGYRYRVCADLSIVALREARKRLAQRGLCVVADVANLPFRADVFGGVVSLHTLHHLPLAEQKKAYGELHRVLQPGHSAAVVNGWTDSPLMRRLDWLTRLMEGIGRQVARLRRRKAEIPAERAGQNATGNPSAQPTGTFVEKLNAAWLRRELAHLQPEIRVWRSVNVRFLRAVIHSALGGKVWLRLLFALEERFSGFFGEKGQYPLIVIRKKG